MPVDRNMRLFSNPLLESLSKVTYNSEWRRYACLPDVFTDTLVPSTDLLDPRDHLFNIYWSASRDFTHQSESYSQLTSCDKSWSLNNEMKNISTEWREQHFNPPSHRCFLLDTRWVHVASVFIPHERQNSPHVVDISLPSSWTSSQSKRVDFMTHFKSLSTYTYNEVTQFNSYLIYKAINIY